MFRTPQDTQGPRPRGRLSGWMTSLMGNTFTPRRDGDDVSHRKLGCLVCVFRRSHHD